MRTRCPNCGDVDIGPDAVGCALPAAGKLGLSEFACPGCGRATLTPIPAARAVKLRLAGAAAIIDPAPVQLDGGHPGTPICWDDLIELYVGSSGIAGAA